MRKSILSILLGGALTLPAMALAGATQPAVYGTVGKMRLLERAPTPPVAAVQTTPARAPITATPITAMPAAWMTVTPMPVVLAPPPGLMLARMAAMTQAVQAQFQQMNRLMAALEATAFAPPPMLPTASPGVLSVSMTTVAAPGGACSETIITRPGPQGTMQVLIHHQGPGCGQMPGMTAMPPAAPSHGVTVQGKHFVPSDRLPPPSKTHFATYLTTPATPHPVKG